MERVGKLLEKLEIQTLVEKQQQIASFLEEAGARGGLTDSELAALGILYAANELLFPTSVLDFIPSGKAISKAGSLIKKGYRAADAARLASAEAKALTDGAKATKNEIALSNTADWKNKSSLSYEG